MAWLDTFKRGMQKTSNFFKRAKMHIADQDELEDILIQSDMGYPVVKKILEEVQKSSSKEETLAYIRKIMLEILEPVAFPLKIASSCKPFIILMSGVNGAGKTTTIGKLANLYLQDGYKVAMVAADTFRAGASAQLQQWGERLNCPVYVSDSEKKDASSLIFDAIKCAQDEAIDILLIDTAGRLQNKKDLMDELGKINRVIKKLDDTAPHASLLVLDATVGQNALSQVKLFQEILPITGLIMTKLDGTAKGGILFALTTAFHLPIHAIGVGEGKEDFHTFCAEEFVDCILGDKDAIHF